MRPRTAGSRSVPGSDTAPLPGDPALCPLGIFSRGRASDLIRVRIDDKLTRIRNNPEAFGEDPVLDLIGYLVLFTLAVEDEASGGAS